MNRGQKLDIIVGNSKSAKVLFDTVIDEIGMTEAIIALIQYLSDEQEETILDGVITRLVGNIHSEKMMPNYEITFNGETRTMAGWAEKLGINYKTLQKRFERGWSVERCLTTKVQGRKVIEVYV